MLSLYLVFLCSGNSDPDSQSFCGGSQGFKVTRQVCNQQLDRERITRQLMF